MEIYIFSKATDVNTILLLREISTPGCIALVDGVHIEWEAPHCLSDSPVNNSNNVIEKQTSEIIITVIDSLCSIRNEFNSLRNHCISPTI